MLDTDSATDTHLNYIIPQKEDRASQFSCNTDDVSSIDSLVVICNHMQKHIISEVKENRCAKKWLKTLAAAISFP